MKTHKHPITMTTKDLVNRYLATRFNDVKPPIQFNLDNDKVQHQMLCTIIPSECGDIKVGVVTYDAFNTPQEQDTAHFHRIAMCQGLVFEF